MLEGGKEFPTVASFLSQLSSEKPHNNRIHEKANRQYFQGIKDYTD